MPVTETELLNDLRDVALQVHNAEERKEDRELVFAAHQSVARLTDRYRELCEGASETERLRFERSLGRRVTDLRRLASLLPRIGTIADSTPDRRAGVSLAGERKITGVSWGAGNRYGDGVATSLRVGGEVEAWCGPCAGLTTHHIAAMVGDEPRQVICQACNSRHNYRTTPSRKASPSMAGTEDAPASYTGSADREAQRRAEKKAEDMRLLANEVNGAAEVRPFDPKERYKMGMVIDHPVFGRGKIETVLRSSILVRFAKGGLKSLMLV